MLGSPEHRITELEKTVAKQADDIELIMTELRLLKKKLKNATEVIDSLRLEVDVLSDIVEREL